MDEQQVLTEQSGVAEGADAAELRTPRAVADVHARPDAQFAGHGEVLGGDLEGGQFGSAEHGLQGDQGVVVGAAPRSRTRRMSSGWVASPRSIHLLESIEGQP